MFKAFSTQSARTLRFTPPLLSFAPLIKALAIGSLALASFSASAACVGKPTSDGCRHALKFSYALVSPNTSSGDLTPGPLVIPGLTPNGVPGVTIDVKPSSSFVMLYQYRFAQRWAVEMGFFALPFKHEVVGGSGLGALGGKFAEIEQIPPMVHLLYYFGEIDSEIGANPYVGFGVMGMLTIKEQSTDIQNLVLGGNSKMKTKPALGYSVVAGVDMLLDDNYYLSVAAGSGRLKTSSKVTTKNANGSETVRTIKHRVDPFYSLVSFGYRF